LPWQARPASYLTASYEQAMKVDRKSKRDVVTNVDYASEALVIKAIRDRFPGDAILAEESGRHERADQAEQSGSARSRGRWSRRTWVIDPLDGTVNYANGIPFFCVSIGLVEDGRPGRRRGPRPAARRLLCRDSRRCHNAQR